MLIDLIEKVRKQPLAVRQQVMVLITLVSAMVITLIWAVGYYLTSDIFREKPAAPATPVVSETEASTTAP